MEVQRIRPFEVVQDDFMSAAGKLHSYDLLARSLVMRRNFDSPRFR